MTISESELVARIQERGKLLKIYLVHQAKAAADRLIIVNS